MHVPYRTVFQLLQDTQRPSPVSLPSPTDSRERKKRRGGGRGKTSFPLLSRRRLATKRTSGEFPLPAGAAAAPQEEPRRGALHVLPGGPRYRGAGAPPSAMRRWGWGSCVAVSGALCESMVGEGGLGPGAYLLDIPTPLSSPPFPIPSGVRPHPGPGGWKADTDRAGPPGIPRSSSDAGSPVILTTRPAEGGVVRRLGWVGFNANHHLRHPVSPRT